MLPLRLKGIYFALRVRKQVPALALFFMNAAMTAVDSVTAGNDSQGNRSAVDLTNFIVWSPGETDGIRHSISLSYRSEIRSGIAPSDNHAVVAGSDQKQKGNVMRWLYNLPDSCIVVLFGLIGAALFVGVLFLRVKLLRFQIQPDHAKATHDALAVVIGFAGLVLAFSLVQEQINVRNLEAQVGTEADNLSQLDRLLVRYGNPGDDALRLSLREYANSIINDEWREQSKGGASGRTAKLFREFSENVSAIDPAPGRQSLIYTTRIPAGCGR